jgi:hypothetical protein
VDHVNSGILRTTPVGINGVAIDEKAQPFRSPLAFSSAMEVVCSAQVQAQKKHTRKRKTGTALNLPAAFAGINIAKG